MVGEKWAVVIGISDYKADGLNLRYADRDAEAIRDFLIEKGGFRPERVRFLSDQRATHEGVRTALFSFLAATQPEDMVLIFLAGHGVQDSVNPDNYFFLAHDSEPGNLGGTAIPMWDLGNVMDYTIRAQRILIFADTCHSGAALDRGGAKDGKNLNFFNKYLEVLARQERPAGGDGEPGPRELAGDDEARAWGVHPFAPRRPRRRRGRQPGRWGGHRRRAGRLPSGQGAGRDGGGAASLLQRTGLRHEPAAGLRAAREDLETLSRMKYETFSVRIEPAAVGSFAVSVRSPQGEGKGTFQLPRIFDPSETNTESGRTGASRDLVPRSAARREAPLDAGKELFRALFRDEVSSLFHACLGSLRGRTQGLRIDIAIDPRRAESAALQNLPWELLCRPETEDFLGLSRRTPIVRSLEAHRERRPAIARPRRLRILAVAASPTDGPPLAVERERANLEAAWKGQEKKVEIVFLQRGGVEEIRQALLAGALSHPPLHGARVVR